MASLKQLLSKPVADIVECPVVEEDEVRLVVEDLESILRKCLHCVRFRMALQLDVLLSVMAQAAALEPERIARGMPQRAEEGTCLDLFCELVAQMVARVNAALRLDVDVENLFEVVQLVCADEVMKNRLGGVLGKLLLDYMLDHAQHMDDYRVHRSCASALITLLRGSSANKNRFSAECGRIATCLEQSTDFFFQMQCVEILFRLHTHNRTVLAQAAMSDHLRRSITSLPNDATLLLSIQNFLDSYNAEFNSARVVPFTIVRMEVDGVEVCSHTTMYFSSLLLVVLLPGGTGDNFTIPFEHIRSVKLSKDHKLGLRLHVVPPKLSLLMSLEEGKDTLHVLLTQSTLAQLRSCRVHQWIADRKRSAPRRVAPLPSSQPVVRRVASSGPGSRGREAAEEEQHQQARRGDSRRTDPRQSPPRASAASSRAASASALHGSGGGGPFPITEREANRPSPRKAAAAARARNEEEAETDEGVGGGRLVEVHRAAALKASRYREEQLAHLQGASDQIQDVLEDMRRQSARDRDTFEASFRDDMAAIRQSEAALKERAAASVQTLNAELEDIQALSTLLRAEADKLRERLAKSLGKSEGVEDACLQRIKKLVDARMQSMEGRLAHILTETNPLADVSQYLSQRISELDVPSTTSRGRRLEYS